MKVRCITVALAALGPLFCLPSLAQVEDPAKAQQWVGTVPDGTPPCIPNAPSGYWPKQCYVEINRDAPVAPPTIAVPRNTAVYVRLLNPRWDESVGFNATVSQTPPPNIPVDALTSLGSPLSNLQASYHIVTYRANILTHTLKDLKQLDVATDSWTVDANTLQASETKIISELQTIYEQVQSAGARYTCLENYREFDSAKASCNFTPPLASAGVAAVIAATVAASSTAVGLSPPTQEIADLTTKLTPFSCTASNAPSSLALCKSTQDSLGGQKTAIDNLVKDIQTAQDALRQAAFQVEVLASVTPPPVLIFRIKEPMLRSATIAVTGTEVVTKTATTIASFTISWPPTGFVLSTGLLGSGLANRTYTASSIILNGVVQTDPTTGKNLSIVTSTNTEPAMDFPVVFGSWVVPWFNRAAWENACPGHCSFLVSGGVGLNLTSKTADLAVGPSFAVWGVLVTPSLVVGRQSVLADGIKVGYTGFGINPPTTLPTTTAWKEGFGIGLTYTLPLP